jgi:hypothetical protein
MSFPMQYALTHLLTDLIGRKVTFTLVTSGQETQARQVYGIYRRLSNEAPLVVKADLPLLGSFAGTLVGLSDTDVQSRLAGPSIEELFTDAIYEVLNVASSAITSEGRPVLSKMVTDCADIKGTAAEAIVMKPNHKIDFNVVVEGYRGGRFTVLS